MNLSDYRRMFFIGIGGSSMSGLARLMRHRGHVVSGSDRDASHTTDQLIAEGIPVAIGHSAQNLREVDLVVYTAAIQPDNPELTAYKEKGVPTIVRPEFLGMLSREYRHSVAVCGTHGKTTVTSMLAEVLLGCGLDPTVHIGGEIPSWNSNVRPGGKELFLTEADEFRAGFLHLEPTIALVLNIDEDHMEFYRDIHHIIDTFRAFQHNMRAGGVSVLCADSPHALALIEGAPGPCITYALDGDAHFTAQNLRSDENGCFSFTAMRKGEALGEIRLSVPGRHNAQNALGALATAMQLGADPGAAIAALNAFDGVHRRFEYTGQVQGVHIYHDYGHNPAEYATVIPIATLIKKRENGRLFVVVQPHTYSRVKRLFDQFLGCFEGADQVLVTDIYAAREVDPGDIHSTTLIKAMQQAGVPAVYCPGFADCKEYLYAHWRPGDVVLTLGCGNINLLNEML